MFSRYRIMRGFLKQKCARDFIWHIRTAFNKKFVRRYCDEQIAKKHLSLFEFNSNDVSSAVLSIRKNGAVEGLSLSAEMVAYFNSLADSVPCFADRDPNYGFYKADKAEAEKVLGKPILVAQYFNLLKDKFVDKLSNDPYLKSIAASYLCASPELMSANMWWTFPADVSYEEKAKHAHVFHYDLDDIKFVKFFFYLTDVDDQSGPHVYVESSNRLIKYKNSWFKSKRFSDEEVVAAYGMDKIVFVKGAAGTCLIEDTITLHKGVTPVSKPRLILQFEYAINTYPEISCERDESVQKIIV